MNKSFVFSIFILFGLVLGWYVAIVSKLSTILFGMQVFEGVFWGYLVLQRKVESKKTG